MKFEHSDILILGDSFCSYRSTVNDWPFIVSEKLSNSSAKTRGYGFGGGSWWSVRNRLIQEVKSNIPKVLILCHTEPNRLPSDYDYGINASSAQEGRVRLNDDTYLDVWKQHEIAKAIKLYYTELWSSKFHKWSQLAWYKELDELISEWQIPYVIHLRCFEHTVDYVFKNGITIEEKLYTLGDFNNNIDKLHNHFTKELNQKIGNRLVELLQNYQQGLQKLSL